MTGFGQIIALLLRNLHRIYWLYKSRHWLWTHWKLHWPFYLDATHCGRTRQYRRFYISANTAEPVTVRPVAGCHELRSVFSQARAGWAAGADFSSGIRRGSKVTDKRIAAAQAARIWNSRSKPQLACTHARKGIETDMTAKLNT